MLIYHQEEAVVSCCSNSSSSTVNALNKRNKKRTQIRENFANISPFFVSPPYIKPTQ